ncbi:MAG: hypothetical protein IKA71_04815, partial [Lentisphaeria bacterium]|nr:hypothetical protein [Lentisphaeria bacterium]
MSENSKIYAITTGSVTTEYLEPVIAETISVNGSSVKSLEVFAGATLSNPANRAVNNNGGTVNIAGATLTACKITGNYNGAALYMEGGTSTLTETVISENTAYRGGAFYVKGGTLTLNDALID